MKNVSSSFRNHSKDQKIKVCIHNLGVRSYRLSSFLKRVDHVAFKGYLIDLLVALGSLHNKTPLSYDQPVEFISA